MAIAALALALSVGCIVTIALRGLSLVCCLAIAGLLGAALGFGAAASCHQNADPLDVGSSDEILLTLRNDTKANASGETAFATAQIDGRLVKVQAVFKDHAARLCGDTLTVHGTYKPASWERDEYLWQNNAIGTLSITSAESVADTSPLAVLRSVRLDAIRGIGSDTEASALAQALACGYRHDIAQTALYSSFQRAGLAHLVAVSGAHLVILTGLVAAALNALRAPRRLSICVLVALMGAYLVLSGMPVSAIRATIMSSVGVLALLGKRRPSSQNALGIGILAIVCADPSASVSTSFVLSALSTAGIVLFSPLVGQWLSRTPLRHAGMAGDALALTLSANVLSQLYACSVFHQLPIIAPIANVATAPVFPFACAGALASALLSAVCTAPSPIIVLLQAPAQLLLLIVSAVSSVTYASVPVSIEPGPAILATIALSVALWVAWPPVSVKRVVPALASIVLAWCAYAFAVLGQDCIIMLDVGQGDAFLVRSKGETMLIDTGNRDSQLIEQLARSGTMRIGTVLITHQDDDHCGALDGLERAVSVDRVLMMSDAMTSASAKNEGVVEQAHRTSKEVIGVKAGDSFSVGTFTVTVVWPERYSDDGGNADSVCVLLEYDGNADGAVDARALFMGDAESEQLEVILKAGSVGKVDVLKVGHHGSKGSFNQDQINVLDPAVALIGVGANNRYGHPAQETLDLLESVGCKVYRSDLDGQVKCVFGTESVRVSLQ